MYTILDDRPDKYPVGFFRSGEDFGGYDLRDVPITALGPG